MNSCKIENIQMLSLNKGQFDFFNDKVFLLLLHANRIPPHLGLIIGGKGYSLTIYGPKVNWELNDIIRLVSVKKVKSMFFELDISDIGNLTWGDLNDLAIKHTIANPSVDSKKTEVIINIHNNKSKRISLLNIIFKFIK